MYPNVERSRLGVTRWGALDPLPRTIRAGLSSWCAIAKRDGKCNIMVRVLAREIPTPSSQSSQPGVVQENGWFEEEVLPMLRKRVNVLVL